MAIDPNVLAKQRIGPHETKCDRCGRRTRDSRGTCQACRVAHVPKLQRLTTEQLTGLIESCRVELKRRREELDAALEGK